MKESARLLGKRIGLSSQVMNYVLKKVGLLEGQPGSYTLTEKGKDFGEYSAHDNGYGGYAHRSWCYPVWDPDKVLSIIDTNPEKIKEYKNEFNEAKKIAKSNIINPDLAENTDDTIDNASRSIHSSKISIAIGILALITSAIGLAKRFAPDNDKKVDD